MLELSEDADGVAALAVVVGTVVAVVVAVVACVVVATDAAVVLEVAAVACTAATAAMSAEPSVAALDAASADVDVDVELALTDMYPTISIRPSAGPRLMGCFVIAGGDEHSAESNTLSAGNRNLSCDEQLRFVWSTRVW